MQFKIIETRQRVTEDTKLQQIGNRTATALQSLANIGRIFGIKTEFLTTMVNLVSSVVAPFKRKKEYTDDEKKVIKALTSNSPQVNGVIQRSLGLAETPIKTPTSSNVDTKKQSKKKKSNKADSDEVFFKKLNPEQQTLTNQRRIKKGLKPFKV
jgi:hypothetical protein